MTDDSCDVLPFAEAAPCAIVRLDTYQSDPKGSSRIVFGGGMLLAPGRQRLASRSLDTESQQISAAVGGS